MATIGLPKSFSSTPAALYKARAPANIRPFIILADLICMLPFKCASPTVCCSGPNTGTLRDFHRQELLETVADGHDAVKEDERSGTFAE
ncbi:hypothetical protein BPY_15290 [Bifidobacterium psychraerophilum]